MSLSKKASDKENDLSSKLPMKNQRIIGDYHLGKFLLLLVKTLGKGTFGYVKLAIHQITNEKVAIKILEKEKIIEVADVERVSREIHILKLIRHKHVIQLYEIIETHKHIFLVMEYADSGEFFDYIVDNQKLSEVEASKYFQEMISGIEYIHQLNIVHRDLKPENLLLDYNKSIKIVDFGLSNTYKNGEQLKTACGSPCYAAPEMIAGQRYDPLLVDIWSLGVILFASVCGQLPFEDQNTSALYNKILNGEFTIPNTISNDGSSFLKGLLVTDPKKRMTIAQIRKHPWFNLYRRSKIIPQGIIIGYNRIPIDDAIVSQLAQKGYNADYIKKCLDANEQNNVTTAYFLLLKKHLMRGGVSIADINSPSFDEKLLQPQVRPLKPPISNIVNSQLMKTLKYNKSGSCQNSSGTLPTKKIHTQQPNIRGMSVPQVILDDKIFKSMNTTKNSRNNYQNSTSSIIDFKAEEQRAKSFSVQNPQHRKVPTDGFEATLMKNSREAQRGVSQQKKNSVRQRAPQNWREYRLQQ